MPDIVECVKGDFQVSSQSAAFRRTVAERMAAYEDRIADRIRRQMDRHGEDPADLAYKLGLNPRTPERWINENVIPQPRQFRALAKHWKIKVEELKPDLEAEEQELRAQLDRIEKKLDEILRRLDPPAEDDALPQTSPLTEDPPPTETSPAEQPSRRAS